MNAGKFVRTLGGWLSVIVAIVVTAIAAIATVWSIDPPWSVNELRGSIVSWGKPEAPNVHVRYYRMWLLVRTDDGRDIGVSSERRVLPMQGERILMQERVGLLGTRSFVEITSGQ